MSEVCLIVDGHNLAHRAKQTQAELHTRAGVPSGVVHGSLTMLRALVNRFNPAGLVVVFDGGRQEKTRIDPTYKANRPTPARVDTGLTPLRRLRGTPGLRRPAPFQVQVRDLGRLLRAAGVPVLTLKGHEADSVIGALTASPTLQGQPLVIVSCDHDFLQLVDDRVKVFDDVPKTMWDMKAVRAHYQIKTPREVSAYKALVGDKSDGIKGVYKCGPVMARKAIRVMGWFIREAPYVQRLSWPSNEVTQRVIGAWIREGLVPVVSDITVLIHCYKLVDIPSAAAAIAEAVEARLAVPEPDVKRVQRYADAYELVLLRDWLVRLTERSSALGVTAAGRGQDWGVDAGPGR